MIQTISQLNLLDLPFGHQRLDDVRLIGNRSGLVESAADGDEIGGGAHTLEDITDARQKRIGSGRRRAAEQSLQWRVDRKRRAARIRTKDIPNAREVVVESSVRGGEGKFAIRAGELRFVPE